MSKNQWRSKKSLNLYPHYLNTSDLYRPVTKIATFSVDRINMSAVLSLRVTLSSMSSTPGLEKNSLVGKLLKVPHSTLCWSSAPQMARRLFGHPLDLGPRRKNWVTLTLMWYSGPRVCWRKQKWICFNLEISAVVGLFFLVFSFVLACWVNWYFIETVRVALTFQPQIFILG